MAISETVVGNSALHKLGAGSILTFDDENERARALKSRFDPVRDALLRAYPWTFAMRRARLSADGVAPTFGYARSFTVPADCVRLHEVDGSYVPTGGNLVQTDGSPAFMIEGRLILTDLPAPLEIRFVSRDAPPAEWDPLFDEALACRLAFDLSEKLTQSSGKKEAALRDFGIAIDTAVRVNAIESPPEEAVTDSWILSRA